MTVHIMNGLRDNWLDYVTLCMDRNLSEEQQMTYIWVSGP